MVFDKTICIDTTCWKSNSPFKYYCYVEIKTIQLKIAYFEAIYSYVHVHEISAFHMDILGRIDTGIFVLRQYKRAYLTCNKIIRVYNSHQ